jgi:1,4-dihydroxy-2-naphthoyl-CoA hydrolase
LKTWDEIRAALEGGLTGALGIEVGEVTASGASGRMPNDGRTQQPMGLVHGGAYAALAETLASLGSLAAAEWPDKGAVGQQVSLNLLRPARSPWIVGVAQPRHLGRTSHVWDVEMRDGEEEDAPLAALARVTLAVLEPR